MTLELIKIQRIKVYILKNKEMTYTLTTASSVLGTGHPTAFISQNRKRVKQFTDTVYLRNKSNFEIELFNPMKVSVLAKLHINGIQLSESGIVLKPGERAFLERMLDTNDKFLFSTYTVENTDEAAHAIQNNGVIQVDFYQEYISPYYPSLIYYPPTSVTHWNNMINSTGTNIHGTTTGLTLTNTGTYNTSNLLCDSNIETGRIEKGNKSSQEFNYNYDTFNSHPLKTIKWLILPDSRKPITVQEINKKYCTECGSKIKRPSYKFCPICGTKL